MLNIKRQCKVAKFFKNLPQDLIGSLQSSQALKTVLYRTLCDKNDVRSENLTYKTNIPKYSKFNVVSAHRWITLQ